MLKLSVALGVPFHEIRTWSCAELALYRAFFNYQPFGEDAENHRHALSRATLVNVNKSPRARPQPPKDFHPFPPPKADFGIGEVRAQMRNLAKRGIVRGNK